jgi:hypothetical protein
MLPVLILVIPPSAIGGGYVAWNLGKHSSFLLLGKNTSTPHDDSSSDSRRSISYIADIITAFGVYGILSTQFPKETQIEEHNATKSKVTKTYVPIHKQAKSAQFQPPATFQEAFHRFGRPVVIRAGAGGFALFCAGFFTSLVNESIQGY